MIVDPDFLYHWRTRMLVETLGDESAPLYVIAVWGHCQSRRSTTFDSMPPAGLKALCRFSGDAAALEKAMIEAGFIERDGTSIRVPKWADHNSSLVSSWVNGAKGGRPKKADNRSESDDSKTQVKPSETQEEPNETQHEPSKTHPYPIREEKKGEDVVRTSHTSPPPSASKPAKGNDETALQAACRETFKAFQDAYAAKYGTTHADNAKVRSQIKQFVQRIGAEEAPLLAAWYVDHPDPYYAKMCHGVDLLLAQCEKLLTEFRTKKVVPLVQPKPGGKFDPTAYINRTRVPS